MNNLEILHLSKQYGKVRGLDDITIRLSDGIYGLLGPNGAGKTTLIKAISGLTKYTEGSILYNEKDIHLLDAEYRDLLGYMPQQQRIDSQYTVYSFLRYISALKGIRKPDERINHLLDRLHLQEYKSRPLSSLSGGMIQRVLIAQSLLNNPKILLLDEPTAGLDPVERRNLREVISSISRNRIVLLATHMMSDVEFISDRILLMKDGKILTDSTQQDLLSRTKVYVSDKPYEDLLKTDSTIRLVNIAYINGVPRIRFISKREYPDQVPATMDDVYLDWMDDLCIQN